MQEVKAPCSKMELQLHRLRHLNQDLLQRLKANQKAFQKQKQSKHLPKAPLAGRATPERTPESQKRKPGQEQLLKGVSSATMAERAPQARQGGPGSPPKISDAEGRKRYRQGHVHPTSPRGAENFVGSATTACKTVTDRRSLLGTQTKPTLPATDMAAENRLELMGILEGKGPKDWRKSEGRTPEERKKRPSSRARILNTPKSILLTPQSKEANEKPKKEASRVTFVSEPEYSVSRESWSIRPFLGYDWIAGLLDVDSSLSEKSEQYFSDLQDFQRVNREDCIYDRDLESDMLGASAYIREQDEDAASHQCVYCYRINKRLFAVPLDSKAACPICKTPRAQRPPETLVEPAFVRVSIPRSTLLPPYKHKIHRRSSYEPADNLGLPSHCLGGWEKSLQAARPTFSSLDLYSSLETRPVNHSYWKSVSRVSGGMATDELLNISRAAEFELSNISRERKQLFSKSTPPVRR